VGRLSGSDVHSGRVVAVAELVLLEGVAHGRAQVGESVAQCGVLQVWVCGDVVSCNLWQIVEALAVDVGGEQGEVLRGDLSLLAVAAASARDRSHTA